MPTETSEAISDTLFQHRLLALLSGDVVENPGRCQLRSAKDGARRRMSLGAEAPTAMDRTTTVEREKSWVTGLSCSR